MRLCSSINCYCCWTEARIDKSGLVPITRGADFYHQRFFFFNDNSSFPSNIIEEIRDLWSIDLFDSVIPHSQWVGSGTTRRPTIPRRSSILAFETIFNKSLQTNTHRRQLRLLLQNPILLQHLLPSPLNPNPPNPPPPKKQNPPSHPPRSSPMVAMRTCGKTTRHRRILNLRRNVLGSG